MGLVFSSKGYNVILIDKDKKNIKSLNHGIMPFLEEGSTKLLKRMIIKKKIYATEDLNEVKKSKYIIICIGISKTIIIVLGIITISISVAAKRANCMSK